MSNFKLYRQFNAVNYYIRYVLTFIAGSLTFVELLIEIVLFGHN